MLLANSGGPPIAGIIASASSYWPVARDNAAGWTRLVTAARASGLKNIPDVTTSDGLPLVRPADGQIDSTTGNQSAGGRLIVELSRQLSLPWRPVVVLACAPLTSRRGCVPAGSDRGRSRGRRGGARGVRRAERNHERSERRPRSLGGLDRRAAVSIRSGQRLLRPAGRRDAGRAAQLAAERARRVDGGQAARHLRDPAGVRSDCGAVGGAADVRGRGSARLARHVGRVRFDAGTALAAGCRRQCLDRHADRGAPRQVSPVGHVARSAHVRP